MSGSETTLRLRATPLLRRRGSRQSGPAAVTDVALSVFVIYRRSRGIGSAVRIQAHSRRAMETECEKSDMDRVNGFQSMLLMRNSLKNEQRSYRTA